MVWSTSADVDNTQSGREPKQAAGAGVVVSSLYQQCLPDAVRIDGIYPGLCRSTHLHGQTIMDSIVVTPWSAFAPPCRHMHSACTLHMASALRGSRTARDVLHQRGHPTRCIYAGSACARGTGDGWVSCRHSVANNMAPPIRKGKVEDVTCSMPNQRAAFILTPASSN